MTHKNFMAVAGTVFGIVAIAHALRFFTGATVVIGGFSVPVWVSAVAAVFAGYMSYQAFHHNK